ncbi:MAG: hypothetical protein ABI986_06080 [Chloroflexota bacterium]
MSSEERKKILQMVEDGKISAEDAAKLMHTLEDDDDLENEAAEAEVEVIESRPGSGYERAAAPEFDEIKVRARRFSLIPLWIGVLITVFSAWAIYSIQRNAGVNFWFYFMTLPLMFGVLLIALGAGGHASRWIYVDVDRRDAEPDGGPKRITLGFPIPLGFVAWFFDKFGHNINGMDNGKVNGIVQMLRATKESGEPLMVDVNDDDARVQVFIG